MRKADNKIITAPVPAEPLAKSYAGPTVLTELTIGKFADHLPFYRQIEMYKRLGIELKQPTIEGSVRFGFSNITSEYRRFKARGKRTKRRCTQLL